MLRAAPLLPRHVPGGRRASGSPGRAFLPTGRALLFAGRAFPFSGRALLPAVLAILLALPAPAPAQEFEAELTAARDRLERGREAGLPLIAPRHFQRAAQRLQEARARYERGEDISRVRRALEEARDALAAAERLREVGREVFSGTLEARARALEANAPELAPPLWEEAERVARAAGRELEDGDRAAAAARVSEVVALYRRAELEALRADVLGPAARLRAAALEADADERAPVTFREAEAALDSANRVLEGDRTRLSEAGRLGERAATAYRRAARISALADSVRRNRVTVEALARRHEEQVARATDRLRFEAELAEGIPPVMDQVVAAIRSLQEDRANLQASLAEREAEVDSLQSRLDTLESRLAGVERREAELAAQLRERQRTERRLREVRAIFSPEEGEVVVSGDSLAIRLYGLTFESGSADIEPAHFSLLTKLQRVIREFPQAPVTVQGHTDSRGNDDFNRALSQRRAIAVREYLLENMAISSGRISAVGYGEDRPIASNDTAEGREKNRRIEVVLDLTGSG